MRKLLALVVALGLAMAQLSLEGLKPSAAVLGGSQGFGLEVSWHCLLFQPPAGEVRPALDLAYTVDGKVNGAFLFRYLYPVAEGLRAGVGLGVAFPGFSSPNLYFRADAEYDLRALLGAPVFLGGDLGLAGGTLAAQMKLGYRF
ncbi:MAG: hypothetical protein NZ846_05075 [Thermus sp.]|uniref:hypothetical protein n=1 Tax=unclassified Thermus TaxID=2619321 RepID=UPI00023893C1|nr:MULTISPECIES: hypothetical protein [unclassified Thermus]AEV16686.1 hypothetical protein TCCBUS3UF1_16450 [Thermus sp. CCB_US3_UF1]MCS6868733.1 hypothetical protein [Thermus sp.]MCS7218331.1 hypothetical protein [Thermus sp.]MDW8016308.1 hypothetical protein [Thermus sp.]MDW8356680.1 hypothetical protein [Thermus sp.]